MHDAMESARAPGRGKCQWQRCVPKGFCLFGMLLAFPAFRCFSAVDLVHQIRDRKSNAEQITAAAEELREKHLIEDSDTYRLVLNTLTKRSAWNDALSIWDEMRWIGTELEEPDFVLAMKAFSRGSQWQATLAVFAELLGQEEMHLTTGRHREDLRPDCRAYTTAIDACRRVAAWTQAVQVLEDMEEMMVTPDVVAYNAVMAACEKGRNYPAARHVLAEFDRYALDPDMVTYNTLIGACGWGQEWKAAVGYLRQMQEKSYFDYDLISYTAAISACAKATEWETALALIHEESRQVKGENIRTYNAALSACASAGKCEHAMLLIEQLLDFDLFPNLMTYRYAIASCEANGEWELALDLMSEMSEAKLEPREMIYRSVAKACRAGGQANVAEAMEMKVRDLEPQRV